MRKRFPAMILALALCIGLAVPVQAATVSDTAGQNLTRMEQKIYKALEDAILAVTAGNTSLDTGSNLLAGSYVTIFLVRTLNVPMRILYPIMSYVENIFDLISQAGVQTLVYLTALQSISPSLYEVAKMEGATAYETFWKVTIPSIMNITFFVVIYTIVDLFLKSSIATEAYSFAFKQGKIGTGSALSVVYMLNVILVLAIAALLLRKVVKKNEK